MNNTALSCSRGTPLLHPWSAYMHFLKVTTLSYSGGEALFWYSECHVGSLILVSSPQIMVYMYVSIRRSTPVHHLKTP